METEPQPEIELSFSWCEACGRDVLTHAVYADAERRLCVHCDGEVSGAGRAVRIGDLEAEGYAVFDQQGCGKPDCGGGRCNRS